MLFLTGIRIMQFNPSIALPLLKIRARRTVRRILWPRPALYWPVGVVRNRGNVFGSDIHLYISGYPRSGNTFARTAFLMANPGLRIRSHRHIPAFVLRAIELGRPGMLLIRNPLDAAISWAIYQRQTLEQTVAYWNDFHEVLKPVQSDLFFVRYEDVVADFGSVMGAFNRNWGTDYRPFEHTKESAAQCFASIDDEYRSPDGQILEMQVSRPSAQRIPAREELLERLQHSSFLREELARANELYGKFTKQLESAVRGEDPAPSEQRSTRTALVA